MLRAAAPLRRTRAIIVKELKHIWLDPGSFFLTILAPAVLLTLLSYVFSFDVDRATIGVIDHDQSLRSREYLHMLTADGDITLSPDPGSYDHIVELFRANRIDAGLVIPPGFARALNAGEPAAISLVVDGSDASTAYQVIGALEGRTLAYNATLAAPGPPPFDVRMRVWFNENLRSQFSMIPGLMAIVLILPAMAVALGVAREKESGTHETLVTTPISGREYLLGKLVVYLALGVFGALLALAVAVFWFRVPFRGSLALYTLYTADYLFALMAFGLLIANFVPSQRTVSSIILLVLFIPSFFLTGLLLPVDDSSAASAAMAFSLPSTHFIVISRGIMLKGATPAQIGTEALTLLAMGAIALAASIALFRKKMG